MGEYSMWDMEEIYTAVSIPQVGVENDPHNPYPPPPISERAGICGYRAGIEMEDTRKGFRVKSG